MITVSQKNAFEKGTKQVDKVFRKSRMVDRLSVGKKMETRKKKKEKKST